jgi:FtsZ-binding cell division protein ZapB
MHRLRLIVLLIIIVALAIALGQAVKSPEPRHAEHTLKGMGERTPSALPTTKRSTPQIASSLPTTNRCVTPISLRVGQIDKQFDIDATVLTTALKNAAHEWNTATGRTLFVVRDDGHVAVNLLFDGRQDSINQLAREQREISALSENLSTQLKSLSMTLKLHKSAVAKWNREMEEHNKLVEMINARSDSLVQNSEDYVALQVERQRIDEMGIDLKDVKQQLVRHRELLDKHASDLKSERESLKARIRSLRERFSSHLLPAGEHRRGLLVNEINAYTFLNLETFHLLLLHEMGHALGVSHIEEQPAIMYPVIGHESGPSNLTPLDIQAALALCGS